MREERDHDCAQMKQRVHDECPYHREAPHIGDVVECVYFILRLVGQVAHVERREWRRRVVWWHLVVGRHLGVATVVITAQLFASAVRFGGIFKLLAAFHGVDGWWFKPRDVGIEEVARA